MSSNVSSSMLNFGYSLFLLNLLIDNVVTRLQLCLQIMIPNLHEVNFNEREDDEIERYFVFYC